MTRPTTCQQDGAMPHVCDPPPAITTDPTTEQAVRTVARRMLADAIDRAISSGYPDWQDCPDIGKYDWEKVLTEVHRLAERTDVQGEHYESAYRHLAGRARETEEGPL